MNIVYAQRAPEEDMMWARYLLQFHISPRLEASAQATNQLFSVSGKEKQLISHYNLDLKLNKYFKVGAGLTYAYKWEWNEDFSSHYNLPEIRPFQQVLVNVGLGEKWKSLGRVRFDERYEHNANATEGLTSGFSYEGRVRFQELVIYRMSSRWHARLGDELFVNYKPEQNSGRRYGQNRIFIGLAYSAKPSLQIDGDFFLVNNNDDGNIKHFQVFRIGILQKISFYESKE